MHKSILVAATAMLAPAAARREPAPAPAPCVTATSRCEQWIVYGNGPARSMVYATHPLDAPNPGITHALVMVHGAARNADHYFETAVGAAFLAGALDHTVIVAPHLIDRRDTARANEVVWPEGRDSWRSGGLSPSNPTISSFDLMDEILRKLADKRNFPNLGHIVVAGHSAGGQFVNRYEMSNKVHGTLGGVQVSYVVANPSTYAWPSASRPLPTGNADPATADKEALGRNGETLNSDFTFAPFDASKLPAYNHWPAGLEQRTGYTAAESDAQLLKQLAERPTTYLLGQVDVLPLGGFDGSPTAMTQGPTRRARGEAFVKFITDSLGARPKAIIVPECGHNDRCIFTTDLVFGALFP